MAQRLKIKRFIVILLLSSAVFIIFNTQEVFAGRFYFAAPDEIKEEDNFSLQAMLSMQNFINALEGEIKYDADFLSVESISVGSSVVPLWVEPPQAVSGSIIRFSGIIPGGVGPAISTESRIFTINFKAVKSGSTKIYFRNYKTYLHQQSAKEGTDTANAITVDILPSDGTEGAGKENILLLDFYPPEPFPIYVTKDKELYDGKYAAIFSAQDKELGIDHYEIRESFLGLFGKWKNGESPYQLLDQNLFSMIEVRAVDKVGRERVEKLIPARLIYATIMTLIIFAFLAIVLIYQFSKKALKQFIGDVFRGG